MRSVLSILAVACCATLALAQPATRTTTTVSYHRISTVVGTSFQLGTTAVGKVTEVVFNDGGCIEYLVVQDSEGYVVVPWTLTTVNYEQKTVTVQSTTVTVEKLRELRFTGERWPDFADATYSQKVQAVWGASAGRGSRAGTSDREESGTKQPDRKGDPARPTDPKTVPPTDPKPKVKPAGPKSKDPPGQEPPTKDSPRKADPKKDGPEKEKEKKKDPDRS